MIAIVEWLISFYENKIKKIIFCLFIKIILYLCAE